MLLWKNKLKPIPIVASKALERSNGTAHFKKCKKIFEHHHLLLLRDIWWSKF
jgi:hypothetical protein